MGSGGRYLLGGKGCSLADPADPMLYLHKEQNNYRTENDSVLHIMMAESSGQTIKLYGQPAGIFEAHVSAGRKRLVIG